MEYDGIQYHGYKVKQAHAMFRSQVDADNSYFIMEVRRKLVRKQFREIVVGRGDDLCLPKSLSVT